MNKTKTFLLELIDIRDIETLLISWLMVVVGLTTLAVFVTGGLELAGVADFGWSDSDCTMIGKNLICN